MLFLLSSDTPQPKDFGAWLLYAGTGARLVHGPPHGNVPLLAGLGRGMPAVLRTAHFDKATGIAQAAANSVVHVLLLPIADALDMQSKRRSGASKLSRRLVPAGVSYPCCVQEMRHRSSTGVRAAAYLRTVVLTLLIHTGEASVLRNTEAFWPLLHAQLPPISRGERMARTNRNNCRELCQSFEAQCRLYGFRHQPESCFRRKLQGAAAADGEYKCMPAFRNAGTFHGRPRLRASRKPWKSKNAYLLRQSREAPNRVRARLASSACSRGWAGKRK